MSAAHYSEWIESAEENYRVARSQYRHKKYPTHNTVCFNAQQCAEKYLKAFLVRQGEAFPRTHDLSELARRCQSVDPAFSMLTPYLERLFHYAVEIRYPGLNADAVDARLAVEDMSQVRRFVRKRLGLSSRGTA